MPIKTFYFCGLLLLASFKLFFFPGWFDSPELSLSLSTLGVSHPPGEPLYNLVGAVFTLLPTGTFAYRTNLLSLFFTLSTVWMSIATTQIITHKKTDAFVFFIFALVLLLCPTLQIQSTRTELYSLCAFLMSTTLYFLVRFHNEKDIRLLYACFSCASLLFLVHTLFGGLAFLWISSTLLAQKRLSLKPLLFFFLPLVFYVYLPLRAKAMPFLNWGNPDTFMRFKNVFFAQDYQKNFEVIFSITKLFSKDFLLSLYLPLIIPFMAGTVFLFNKNKTLLTIFFIGILFQTSLWFIYPFTPQNPDVHGYLLQTHALMFPLVLFGLDPLFSTLQQQLPEHRFRWIQIGLISILCILNFTSFEKFSSLTGALHTQNLSSLLREIPPHAVIEAESDHWVFPLWYHQHMEGARPDVMIVARGLLPAKWYQQQLDLSRYQTKYFFAENKNNHAHVQLFSHAQFKPIHFKHVALCYDQTDDYFDMHKSICRAQNKQWAVQLIEEKRIQDLVELIQYEEGNQQKYCFLDSKNIQPTLSGFKNKNRFLSDPNDWNALKQLLIPCPQ